MFQIQKILAILGVVMLLSFVLRMFFWLLGLLSPLLFVIFLAWIVSRTWHSIRNGGSSGSSNTSANSNSNNGRWRNGPWFGGTWYTGWYGSGSGQTGGSRNYRTGTSGGYTGWSSEFGQGRTGDYTGGQSHARSTMTRDQALAVFGLPQTASKDDIRKRYREFVKKYHPDRLGTDATPEARKAAEERFAQINVAHDLLTR